MANSSKNRNAMLIGLVEDDFDESWDERDGEYLLHLQIENSSNSRIIDTDISINNTNDPSSYSNAHKFKSLKSLRPIQKLYSLYQYKFYQYIYLMKNLHFKENGYHVFKMKRYPELASFVNSDTLPLDCINTIKSSTGFESKNLFQVDDELLIEDYDFSFDSITPDYHYYDIDFTNQNNEEINDWDETEEEIFTNVLIHKDSETNISRQHRAKQIAIDFLIQCDWEETYLSLFNNIFYESGWSSTRLALKRFIDQGMGPHEVNLAYNLKQYWRENDQYHITFNNLSNYLNTKQTNAVHWFLSWPQALRIIISFKGIPSLEEVVELIDMLFDNWYNSSFLQGEFTSFHHYVCRYFEYSTDGLKNPRLFHTNDNMQNDEFSLQEKISLQNFGHSIYRQEEINNHINPNVMFIYGEPDY